MEGSSGRGKGKRRHYPSDKARADRDKRLFVYQFNQGGESCCRDNKSKPYPALHRIRERMASHQYRGLNLEPYTKALLHRGLREIHHVGDQMDGRMDACLGYLAVLTAETFKSIGEVREDIRGVQKKAAQEGWERTNLKREFEDQLREAHDEISDLKYRVASLESLVDRLVNPPREAVFRPASPLPDIGYPPVDIPGLDFSPLAQADLEAGLGVIEENWERFNRDWPSGVGYVEDAKADKENQWITVPVDE